ncbi:hypothetical protein OBBRIDRAFT_540688 [Obba rivulosa]|uniref:Uncharacterized protein n=1 Tax=Obba rivulosa TaxID=1052685 RepID=A0A8E2DTZ8_9APHY|nr:hypothetical protein OBBRIDRAFT_540688 [Obba rivulosa]
MQPCAAQKQRRTARRAAVHLVILLDRRESDGARKHGSPSLACRFRRVAPTSQDVCAALHQSRNSFYTRQRGAQIGLAAATSDPAGNCTCVTASRSSSARTFCEHRTPACTGHGSRSGGAAPEPRTRARAREALKCVRWEWAHPSGARRARAPARSCSSTWAQALPGLRPLLEAGLLGAAALPESACLSGCVAPTHPAGSSGVPRRGAGSRLPNGTLPARRPRRSRALSLSMQTSR